MNDTLYLYQDLVLFWNKKINLISKKDESIIMERHIQNSLLLQNILPNSTHKICDVGSGGGFPAIPLMIMGGYHGILVESDQRKAVFLREVVRQCGLSATIIQQRIETMAHIEADILTARAFAPLDILLDLCYQQGLHMPFYLLKGQNYSKEIQKAKKKFAFTYNLLHRYKEGVIIQIDPYLKLHK